MPRTQSKPKKHRDDASINEKFDWELYPETEKFMVRQVDLFLSKNRAARNLSERMANETSTRFFNWVDHMVIPESSVRHSHLEKLGFSEFDPVDGQPESGTAYRHSRSYFFPIVLGKRKTTELALKPDEVDSFLQMCGNGVETEGAPFSRFRRAEISKNGEFVLSAVERRGYDGFTLQESEDIEDYIDALGLFFRRRRNFGSDKEGVNAVERLISESLHQLDDARVSDAFFRSERAYWERRNRSGQVQKSRQDRLGLGWGNQDHHTYRSSRANFSSMIRIFEKMGYYCREKYYAGDQARWGAQILEHPVCNVVIFTDVDLYPEETEGDFPHKGLEQRKNLGTVGLWIGLHGESILQAGMHHLEARFDFERLKIDLPKYGINVLPPFSYFAFLKQAFTAGEIWQVDRKRLDKLLESGSITDQQYKKFDREGAIGSHMENLERAQGFKGFNKSSVTKIIKATDPRVQGHYGA
ncbi:MAG: hypothetical protein KGH94_01875 [Candidatus Micrarchaeota archaeon]|nr:hypothetical protein [Candidatus Micrarchaeota archaeon]